MLRFASLGSGSKGNATVVEGGGSRVLIDCGFTLGEAETRLDRLGLEPGQLDAILVTHEHGDHLGGVGRLARRHALPVYLTHGTARRWRDAPDTGVHRFDPEDAFRVGALEVQPFAVPHDAAQPCQYLIRHQRLTLGVLSDLGHVTPHVQRALMSCDALLLESNHDPELLAAGPYPPSLKQRVGGAYGHLSNAQAGALLRQLPVARLQHLWLTHLSEVNNRPELALGTVCTALDRELEGVRCADQLEGFGWCEVLA